MRVGRIIMCPLEIIHTSPNAGGSRHRLGNDLQDGELSRPGGHDGEQSEADDEAGGRRRIEGAEHQEAIPSTHYEQDSMISPAGSDDRTLPRMILASTAACIVPLRVITTLHAGGEMLITDVCRDARIQHDRS